MPTAVSPTCASRSAYAKSVRVRRIARSSSVVHAVLGPACSAAIDAAWTATSSAKRPASCGSSDRASTVVMRMVAILRGAAARTPPHFADSGAVFPDQLDVR
ncbi:hypothetical protein [Flexivirga lutea]